MRNKLFIWAVDIQAIGNKDINNIKTVHVLGYSLIHASHVAAECLDDSDEYDYPIEILNIRKNIEIVEILNVDDYIDDESDGYDPEMPYKMAENAPDEQLMKFKCTCKNEVKVMDGNWPYIKCKDCSRTILRRDIELIGGMFIFHPSN